MFHIAYVSSATVSFSKPMLDALLKRSRDRNTRMEITGMLLYGDGNFMQVIEGPEEKVRSLFRVIAKDPRHKDVFTLFEEPLEVREFSDWSMAYHDVEGEDDETVPGYSDFLNGCWSDGDGTPDAGKARRMLTRFRERMR